MRFMPFLSMDLPASRWGVIGRHTRPAGHLPFLLFLLLFCMTCIRAAFF